MNIYLHMMIVIMENLFHYCYQHQKKPIILKLYFLFFDGLIPEGYLLEKGSKMYNISLLDRMGLLLELCNDCIGAVTVFKVKK